MTSKRIIKAPDAPKAVGAYSHAVQVADWTYISGQIPLDPETMQLVSGGIEAQIHQVFKNLAAVIRAADCTFDDVVRLTIYMIDLNYFSKVNEIMMHYFKNDLPARATVEVKGLPKGAEVEIDAILFKSS